MSNRSTANITITVVRKMQPGDIIHDTQIKGYGVRKQQKAATYFLKTRVKGRQRWISIGKHGSPWTPDKARKEALRLLGEIAAGNDPVAKREREKATLIFESVARRFLDEHGRKLKVRTLEEYERLIRRQLVPAFGKMKIDALTRSDVMRFHSHMSDSPRNANHALAVLSKMMSWCEEHGFRKENSNPCRGIKKYHENRRERFLTPEEFAGLGEVLRKIEEDQSEGVFIIAAVRLLALTGARLSEILTLRWEYVDIGRMRLWLPDSKTGKKVVNLNEQAIEVLKAIPRIEDNPYVIVGNVEGAHLVNLQKPWRRIRKRVGLDDVRLHDLRHSFASIAVASGASLPMIGKLLGHMRTETTARYAHLANDPIQQVNQDVGLIIGNAMARQSGEAE